jgi:hypothetical protein
VTVTSSDGAVARVDDAVMIAAGQRTATVPIATGVAGVAVLTLRAGDIVREITVVVGTPPAGLVPPIVAKPVGVSVIPPPSLGFVFTPVTSARSVTVSLVDAPAAAATPVTVTSSNPSVAQVTAEVGIAAGERGATVPIASGQAGVAVLTLRAGGVVREITVVVGTPPAGLVPPIVAKPVGVSVIPPPSLGSVFASPSASPSVVVAFLPASAAQATAVEVTSSNPAVATVSGPVSVAAGQRSVSLPITTGQQGVATLTLRAGEVVREITVVVGTPPAGFAPPALAAPVGVSVRPLASIGQVVAPVAAASQIGLPLLGAPASNPTPVAIATTDATVARVDGSVTIPSGSAVATFTITTGAQGVATLTLEVGGQQVELTVVVGTPARAPAVVARPIGVCVGQVVNAVCVP